MLARAAYFSLLLIGLASASSVQAAQSVGQDVVVGSFKMKVEIDDRSIKVERRRLESRRNGDDDDDDDNGRRRRRHDDDDDDERRTGLPSVELRARFGQWDPQKRIASIFVSLHNVSEVTLFAPRVLVLRVSPRSVTPGNPNAGSGPGSWVFIYDSASLGGATMLHAGLTSGEKSWEFLVPSRRDEFKVNVDILAGVPVPPGEGMTIQGPGGTSVTIQPNSIPYEALVDINPVPLSAISAPLGTLVPAGAIEVTFQPVEIGAELLAPRVPFQLSVPVPATTTATQFIVGQVVLTDFFQGPSPGLREQLVPVDTAMRVGGNMVTQATIFPGIFSGGVFVFIENTGSGYATGTVSDKTGPRRGVVVSNSTNTLVAITDFAGSYKLFINGGPFTVDAFDPFRASSGTASGNIATPQSEVVANIALSPLAVPRNTRDGIRNGGFELGDLSGWITTGAARASRVLASDKVSIVPTEGDWMADINTGTDAVEGVGSGLKQRFNVPAGARTLRCDFNFISEEFPEFVDTIFDDSFRAIITTPDGESTFAQVSVNSSGGFQEIGDCDFPGGDSTCGQTGWREGSVDLSKFAGTDNEIEVQLLFTAVDAGDNIFDTHVLIDNIRFSTVWIDVKIMNGAGTDAEKVMRQVLEANEILSQAGINVRLRRIPQAIADPGGLLETELSDKVESRLFGGTKLVATAEQLQLLGLARSSTVTDVNIYYVGQLKRASTAAAGLGTPGVTVKPDGYHDIDILTTAGVMFGDVTDIDDLAHEIGHMLISPGFFVGNTLEHGAGSGNFMDRPKTTPDLLEEMNRQQSANINRDGAPLLVP